MKKAILEILHRSVLVMMPIVFGLITIGVAAQDFPDPPQPPRLVNDFTNFLTTAEVGQLEDKLVAFDRETSTQIAIVIVPTLHGYEKMDYAFRLAERWGIGREGKDNGILILVKPKTDRERGEVAIATGYGLEGAVPDAIAKRIVEVEILPRFREEKYFAGLDAAAGTLMSLTRGEFTAEEYAEAHPSQPGAEIGGPALFILIVFFFIFLRALRSRQYSAGKRLPLWTALFLAGAASRSHRGHFGSFSSGSGRKAAKMSSV